MLEKKVGTSRMNIYIVREDISVEGAFSTLENAQEYMKLMQQMHPDKDMDYTVYGFVVDELVGRVPRMPTHFGCICVKDGKIYDYEPKLVFTYPDFDQDVFSAKDHRGNYICGASFVSQEHLHALLRERLEQVKAQKIEVIISVETLLKGEQE